MAMFSLALTFVQKWPRVKCWRFYRDWKDTGALEKGCREEKLSTTADAGSQDDGEKEQRMF